MPVRRERIFIIVATSARRRSAPSMATSKRPHSPHASAARIARSPSAGRRVSAWRKTRNSPRAACAPAFICAPRPRGASTTRSHCAPARLRVSSRLPPSTTTTSAPCPRARPGAARPAAIPRASSSTGMTMEMEPPGMPGILPCVVERPVVVEERDLGLLLPHRGAILGLVGELVGVLRHRRLHRGEALVALLEVLAVPVEDLRDLEAARLRIVAVARPVGEEALHAVLERALEVRSRERLVAKHRAADRRADHRDVHARIVVDAVLA